MSAPAHPVYRVKFFDFAFERRRFSGNPPHAPIRRGWIVRLGGPASKPEKAWLKAHGYEHASQGKWARADRNGYVCKRDRIA